MAMGNRWRRDHAQENREMTSGRSFKPSTNKFHRIPGMKYLCDNLKEGQNWHLSQNN